MSSAGRVSPRTARGGGIRNQIQSNTIYGGITVRGYFFMRCMKRATQKSKLNEGKKKRRKPSKVSKARNRMRCEVWGVKYELWIHMRCALCSYDPNRCPAETDQQEHEWEITRNINEEVDGQKAGGGSDAEVDASQQTFFYLSHYSSI